MPGDVESQWSDTGAISAKLGYLKTPLIFSSSKQRPGSGMIRPKENGHMGSSKPEPSETEQLTYHA